MPPELRTPTSSTNPHATFKFPSYPPDTIPEQDEYTAAEESSDRGVSPGPSSTDASAWTPQKKAGRMFANGIPGRSDRRGRQKSLSEALRTIHNRRGSVTDNAREIGEALKAPVSFKLIVSDLPSPAGCMYFAHACSSFADCGIWPPSFQMRRPRRSWSLSANL